MQTLHEDDTEALKALRNVVDAARRHLETTDGCDCRDLETAFAEFDELTDTCKGHPNEEKT